MLCEEHNTRELNLIEQSRLRYPGPPLLDPSLPSCYALRRAEGVQDKSLIKTVSRSLNTITTDRPTAASQPAAF